MNSACVLASLVVLAVFGNINAATTSTNKPASSAVVDFFSGDDCISSESNVVGHPVTYVLIPGGRPDMTPLDKITSVTQLSNIKFTPPFFVNRANSNEGDVIAQVIPPGNHTVVESFTANGVNYRNTFTVTVGGFCDEQNQNATTVASA